MHCAESLTEWKRQTEEMTARLAARTADVDEKTLNTAPDASLWSPAQIIEHLVLSNRPYLQIMTSVLQTAQHTSADPPIHYSFFGKILCQAAGPDGNAPAPKALHPRTTSIPLTILTEWRQQMADLLALLDGAAGVDLSAVRVWNPLVRILPMNLADCFALLAAHTERHLRQIEARLPASP